MSAGVFADVVEAQRVPTLVRLAPNLYALAYRLMKMVQARHILRRAQESGRLNHDTTVVETDGLGNLRSRPCHAVRDRRPPPRTGPPWPKRSPGGCPPRDR
jgi:hypothetical protein